MVSLPAKQIGPQLCHDMVSTTSQLWNQHLKQLAMTSSVFGVLLRPKIKICVFQVT